MILLLGPLSFGLFFLVFRLVILKWDLKTPGREDAESLPKSEGFGSASGSEYAQKAGRILEGLGGTDNVISVDNCITRLRLELADPSLMDEAVIKSAGALGVIRTGGNSVQVVVGTTVQFVADELRRLRVSPSR